MQNLSDIVLSLIPVVGRLCIQCRRAKLMHATNFLHAFPVPGDKVVEAVAGYVGLILGGMVLVSILCSSNDLSGNFVFERQHVVSNSTLLLSM